MSGALVALTQKLAARFEIESGDSQELVEILKQTCFRQKDNAPVSDAQMTALMIIAQQYGLNPWTKEIYAYPDKGAIIPVIGVDGWNRIANQHPEYDGMEFRYSENTSIHKGKLVFEWIECVVYRKDKPRPTVVREYFDEVVRVVSFPTPWDTHPKRMHRHKAEIQGLRMAFGFSGIYEDDEAERIINPTPNDSSGAPATKTDDILSGLAKKQPKPEEKPYIDGVAEQKSDTQQPVSPALTEVFSAIAAIASKADTDAAKELIGKLQGDDRIKADEAYKAKIIDIKAKADASKQQEAFKQSVLDFEAAIDGCVDTDELLTIEETMPEEIYKVTSEYRAKKLATFSPAATPEPAKPLPSPADDDDFWGNVE